MRLPKLGIELGESGSIFPRPKTKRSDAPTAPQAAGATQPPESAPIGPETDACKPHAFMGTALGVAVNRQQSSINQGLLAERVGIRTQGMATIQRFSKRHRAFRRNEVSSPSYC